MKAARILGWGLTAAVLWAVAATAAADDPLPAPGRPGAAGAPPAGRSSARVGPTEGTAPRGTVAAPGDYRLTAGDEIEIEVVLPSGAEADNPVKEPKRILVAPGGV